jgi:signal transduction histidine kinase
MDSEVPSRPGLLHDQALRGRLLEALVQQIPSGVLIVEAPGGRVLFANRQISEALGDAATAVGVKPIEAWRGFRADGRELEADDWPLAAALRDGEAPSAEEIELIRADGSRGLFSVTASPLRDHGTAPVAVLVTCLDITDQRRRSTSRKFLADASTLLTTSADPLSALRTLARLAVPTLADWCTVDLLDDDGQIQRVAVEHLDPRKSAAATALARRHPPRADSEAGVARVIRTGESELVPEVTPEVLRSVASTPGHLKLLQELGICSVMLVPLKARLRVLGAIIFVSAESRRRFSQEDLEIAEELAARAALVIENSKLLSESQAALEAKSDFLAVMSHELRTPLTAIIGYAELLQLGVPEPVTPRQREQAERIEISARHLLQLIEEILTLVTLDTGAPRVRQEELRLSDLLKRAAAVIEPMARAKGIPITISAGKPDTSFQSDPDKLLQIVLNLLSNAVKFTEQGEIRLSGRVEDGLVVLEVSDTGIGLEREHVERIFEPFWQVERPITRRAGGTGLGLTICRRLTDLLGGDIRVESTPGLGSTFIVRIPVGDGFPAPDRAAPRN